MINYESLEENATKKELIELIKKLDSTVMNIHTSIETIIRENMALEERNNKLNEALDKACIEIAGAYKKYAKNPKAEMEKPELWKSKFQKQ